MYYAGRENGDGCMSSSSDSFVAGGVALTNFTYFNEHEIMFSAICSDQYPSDLALKFLQAIETDIFAKN